MTNLNQDALTVLTNLRNHAEGSCLTSSKDGSKWVNVYLDNARKGMEKNKFRAALATLSKAGLYRVIDGYAWGDVKVDE